MSGQQLAMAVGVPMGVFVIGVASGFVPVLNAEAVLTAAVLNARGPWIVLAVALALGQSTAKTVLFIGSRHGAARMRRCPMMGDNPRGRRIRLSARWKRRTAGVGVQLQRPVAGAGVVALSSVAGIPPLAATAILAGAAQMPLTRFYPACLGGRLVRFGLIAVSLTQLND
jgi:membrane protein YqaA with SNARE-associated domain